MPNKKKKYSARFPPARIKKIMQKDDEVGKVAAAVPVIISRSLELFVESLIKKTNNLVVARNARTLTPQHIKQTVLVENEFKFLHELVAAIPDVQSTEEDQPSSHLTPQPPLQEASIARSVPDPVPTATTATSTAVKPGGKQRGRPRKTKPEEVKQIKAKKPRLASSVEECDSEETCSGSEDETKELDDQSKQLSKVSTGQKPIKIGQYLPTSVPTTLQNTILFSSGLNSHIINEVYPSLSVELPTSSKMAEAYMTLNGSSASSFLGSEQVATPLQNMTTATSSNDEALDLSTSGVKNGDMKLKNNDVEVNHQNLLQSNTLPIPRTFYMTNVLSAGIQTMSGPPQTDVSIAKPHNEAYKLNIPKISVQTGITSLIKPDLMSPSTLLQGCRPSLSQPPQNFDHATRSMASPPAITYQIQNLAQKGHSTQIILSQMRPETNDNIGTDAQIFNAGSPVRLLQYPRFVSLVPRVSFGEVKSPTSCSTQVAGSLGLYAPSADDSKLNLQSDCATKDSQSSSQS